MPFDHRKNILLLELKTPRRLHVDILLVLRVKI